MATNLAIDPDLLERAVRVSAAKSKTAAVTQALAEFREFLLYPGQAVPRFMDRASWRPSFGLN